MTKLIEQEPAPKTTQYVQLSVVVAALAIGGYLVFSYLIWPIIWWILAVLGVFVLAINYKMVSKIIKWLVGLYKKNTWLGVGATVGGFLAFTPFMVFLFVKTIWDFRNSSLLGKKKQNSIEDAEAVEIKEEPKLPPSHLDKNKGGFFQ